MNKNKIWISEEVVKGLECCNVPDLGKCNECPFLSVVGVCHSVLKLEAAALIRRRDAVIAKLEDIINSKKGGAEE